MNFKSLMHISFYTSNLERIREFYEEKLELNTKIIVRYKSYQDRKGSKFYELAHSNPNDICIIYIELAEGQFIEFFPISSSENKQVNESYSHFALLVDDIHLTREKLVGKGIQIDIEPKLGNSHTWQMWIHDPDGNRIEIMQYTKESFQITGHIE